MSVVVNVRQHLAEAYSLHGIESQAASHEIFDFGTVVAGRVIDVEIGVIVWVSEVQGLRWLEGICQEAAEDEANAY